MGIRPSNTIFPYHHVFSDWDHARTAPAFSCISTTYGGCCNIGTLLNRVASRLHFHTYRKNSRNVVVEHNSRDATMNSAVAHKAATIFHGRLWGPAKPSPSWVRGHPLRAKIARILIRPLPAHNSAYRTKLKGSWVRSMVRRTSSKLVRRVGRHAGSEYRHDRHK